MSVAVVWLKRDLRLTDHQPLCDAVATGLPVLLIYNFEPLLIQDEHYSRRHWRFVAESLTDIKSSVPEGAFHCFNQPMLDVLETLDQALGIKFLFSHQEIGLNNTFLRDKQVSKWCELNKVIWHESVAGGVMRGKKDRIGWDLHWNNYMQADLANVDLTKVNWLSDVSLSGFDYQAFLIKDPNGEFQSGGEQAANEVMRTFFLERGQSYAFKLSSPSQSQQYCSRLSAYLAWGNLSLRQVYQQTLNHWNKTGWRRSLVAFSSRLHWHCHFIQKFESECEMEFRPVNRGYLDLPRKQDQQTQDWLFAWQQGNTGIPMVDACMRCLIHTGYINFRMRAMLVSVLCHHLEIDWQLGVKHLARLFLDFEPGIHYSQFQMQAGVTGINTIRIYNPIKQGQEKDPDGQFIKTWLPELKELPETMVHTPWLLTDMEQAMFGVVIGEDYPEPLVELDKSYKKAQALLWSWRNKPAVVAEKHRLLRRHVRPE